MDHLSGKINSPWNDAASGMATEIVRNAQSAAAALEKGFPGPPGTGTPIGLVLDLSIILLHLADRMAFEILGPERRPTFVDPLVAHTIWSVAAIMPREAGQSSAVYGTDLKKFVELASRQCDE